MGGIFGVASKSDCVLELIITPIWVQEGAE